MLESAIEQPVVRWARSIGILVTKLQGIGNRSFPDRIFWIPGGRPLLIEFKAPGKKPTCLQKLTIERLRQAGYAVEVCDSQAQARQAIQSRLAQ